MPLWSREQAVAQPISPSPHCGLQATPTIGIQWRGGSPTTSGRSGRVASWWSPSPIPGGRTWRDQVDGFQVEEHHHGCPHRCWTVCGAVDGYVLGGAGSVGAACAPRTPHDQVEQAGGRTGRQPCSKNCSRSTATAPMPQWWPASPVDLCVADAGHASKIRIGGAVAATPIDGDRLPSVGELSPVAGELAEVVSMTSETFPVDSDSSMHIPVGLKSLNQASLPTYNTFTARHRPLRSCRRIPCAGYPQQRPAVKREGRSLKRRTTIAAEITITQSHCWRRERKIIVVLPSFSAILHRTRQCSMM